VTTNRPSQVLVLDMASLRFRKNAPGTACAVLTRRGELLTAIDISPRDSDRDVIFRGLDAALDRGQVIRTDSDATGGRTRYRLALYNPYTAEISVHAIPATVTFAAIEPVELPVDGDPAVVTGTGRNSCLRLGDRHLYPRQLSFTALTRRPLAHAA
jgi:hypothetical protein